MTEPEPTVGVGPHPDPWPDDPRLDPVLLAEGDRRNVLDVYRYWSVEAWVVGPRFGMRPDADGRLWLAHDARRAPASQRSLPPGIVWTCSVQSEPFQ